MKLRKISRQPTQHIRHSRHSRPMGNWQLYTKIDGQTQIRTSSAHQVPLSQRHQTVQAAFSALRPTKKVGFKLTVVEQLEQNFNSGKMRLVRGKKETKTTYQQVQSRTLKSLDCSFIGSPFQNSQPQQKKSIKTLRSIRSSNPELNECKKTAEDILRKLRVFQLSNFCFKQLATWVSDYFHTQKYSLATLFIKPQLKKKGSIILPHILQTDQDTVLAKLETKQRDYSTGLNEYIKLEELTNFSDFLQKLYAQRSKIHLRQIEQSMKQKMTQINRKARRQEDSKSLLTIRQKPSEVLNFMEDLHQFQSQMGSLKRIPTINRNQFKLLKETDAAVDSHLLFLNQEFEESARRNQVQIIH